MKKERPNFGSVWAIVNLRKDRNDGDKLSPRRCGEKEFRRLVLRFLREWGSTDIAVSWWSVTILEVEVFMVEQAALAVFQKNSEYRTCVPKLLKPELQNASTKDQFSCLRWTSRVWNADTRDFWTGLRTRLVPYFRSGSRNPWVPPLADKDGVHSSWTVVRELIPVFYGHRPQRRIVSAGPG